MKICPKCSTEYYPHIEDCADCGSVLISKEENARLREEKKRLTEGALDDPVAVREGDIRWINELFHVLIDSGISGKVLTDAGCKKGCRGDTVALLVSRRDGQRAHERIEEYFAEIHPEARAAREMMSQGKCPACGCTVSPEAVECPECGLTLLIIE